MGFCSCKFVGFLVSLFLLLFGIFFGFFGFPRVFQQKIEKNFVLAPETPVREMWERLPFHLDFKVFLFNVTNAEEVMEGGVPHLQEVGPYFFKLQKEKVNVVEDPKEDTIKFNAKDSYFFCPELSQGLTGDEELVFPNMVLLGMAISVSHDHSTFLPMISNVIKTMWHNPSSAFIRVKAMDLLFNGIDIDCSAQDDDFETRVICTIFEDSPTLKSNDGGRTYKFSLFGHINATESLRYKVLRGVKNLRDVGRVIEYDDETQLDAWEGEKCNEIKGTDGTIFPPNLKIGEEISVFRASLCRSVPISFVNETSYADLPVSSYTLDFPDSRGNEDLQCFCGNVSECHAEGLFFLSPCSSVPLVVSLPHFLTVTEERVLKGVSGLKSIEERHRSRILFERITGTPIFSRQRIQFNLEINPLKEIEVMTELPEVILPLFWIDEGVALNETFTDQMKHMQWVIRGNGILRYIFIITGLLGVVILGHMIKKHSSEGKNLEPVKDISYRQR